MFPCIKESSLGIFAATADQRYICGEDVFLRTHYPMTMKRFRPGGGASSWTEEDLLRELVHPPSGGGCGNRTFVLYGAAGSGKSEMIRWLECQIGSLRKNSYALRISRTELDPVKILQKILSTFRGSSLGDDVCHQWEDLRCKPVTLANHLVWSALGKMLPSDEEIVPISYRLRPIIESNLRLNFSGMDSPGELEGRTPELISLEDLEELARQCSLPLEIDCGQLRYLMARELEQAVLGGHNFVNTLKSISQELMSREGARPLLLIDDLVQSMNIYSTDLLDFFITMEEGSWDIVLGLTPASFETSKRGREILGRITTLDTFEDRITKLWLTDEQGHGSYFIEAQSCHLFAEKYLLECKRLGGFTCGPGCAMVQECTALQAGMSQLPNLSPFNPALLGRIYSALPRGKGKARYFIGAIGDILQEMSRGNLPEALGRHIDREMSADHQDPGVRLLVEAYAPGGSGKRGSVKFSGRALSALLNTPCKGQEDIEVRVSDLSSPRSQAQSGGGPDTVGQPLEIDSSKAAVRDWLEGREVNKELLKGLRLGISYLCRELAQPCSLMPPNTSRMSPQLRWDETVEGSRVPVALEGLDEFEGIRAPRALGHAAYQLNYIHLKRGGSKEQALASALGAEEVHCLVHSAQELRSRLGSRLEGELGLPVQELAYLLFIMLMELGQGGDEVPVAIKELYPGGPGRYPPSVAPGHDLMPGGLAQIIRALFKDWLLIRENIYDAVRLIRLSKRYRDLDPVLEIFKINTDSISPQFKVADLELKHFIGEVQRSLGALSALSRGEAAIGERKVLEQILSALEGLQHPGTHAEIGGLLSAAAQNLGIAQPVVPDWQACQRLRGRVRRRLRSYMGRGGGLNIGSPIAAHRFLQALGEISGDPDYAALREVLSFMQKAVNLIEGAGPALRNAAEGAGVAGHLALSSKYNQDDIGHLCNMEGLGLEGLAQLAGAAREVALRRRHIKYLEMASPFIDHGLAQGAGAVARALENTAALNLGPMFMEKVGYLLQQCRDYARAVENMLCWDGAEGSWEGSLRLLSGAHREIGRGRLRDSLLCICQEWRCYIKNFGELCRCLEIGGGDLPTICKKAAGSLGALGEGADAAEVAGALYAAGACLDHLPSPSQIEGQLAAGGDVSYTWVLNTLLLPQAPELALSSTSLEDLKTFCGRYPALAGSVKVKMYLSQVN